MSDRIIAGIDLGTTNSCISVIAVAVLFFGYIFRLICRQFLECRCISAAEDDGT